jgi:predicted dehydrogenase
MTKRLRSGIVGLGQVGLLFDEDPKRRGVWTHFSAYERLARHFDLVAVCDIDPVRRKKALDRRNVRAYESLETMLAEETLDVVSLCTPLDLHAQQILQCAGRVRAIVCEKPLSAVGKQGREAVERCEETGTVLVVNYYKRFEPGVALLRKRLLAKLGDLRQVIGLYSGPFESVGSHMIDLLRFISGELTLRSAWRSESAADAWCAVLQGSQGQSAVLLHTGRREDLIFELDVIGTKGRATVSENGSRLLWQRFRASERYSGYRELHPAGVKLPLGERFLPLFHEVRLALGGRRVAWTIDGRDALRTQDLLDSIQGAALRL